MPAVPCQPQTEAVFISHAANWPAGLLGCWARSSAGCYVPARDDLIVWLLCLPVCLLLACPVSVFLPVRQSLTDSLSVFLSDYSPGCLSAASLDISRPVTFLFFIASPPACQSSCSSCRAVSLPSSLWSAFVILSARLPVWLVWLPSWGMSGQVPDNKDPADPPLTYKKGGREGRVRENGGRKRRRLW